MPNIRRGNWVDLDAEFARRLSGADIWLIGLPPGLLMNGQQGYSVEQLLLEHPVSEQAMGTTDGAARILYWSMGQLPRRLSKPRNANTKTSSPDPNTCLQSGRRNVRVRQGDRRLGHCRAIWLGQFSSESVWSLPWLRARLGREECTMTEILYKIPVSAWVSSTAAKMEAAGVEDRKTWSRYWVETYQALGGTSTSTGTKGCPDCAAYALCGTWVG